MIEVPAHDRSYLWTLNPDQFNLWRRQNDLPMLLAFFKEELPSFTEWLAEYGISDESFYLAPHTGEWFLGEKNLELSMYTQDGIAKTIITENFDTQFAFLSKHHKIDRLTAIPFMPYPAWGVRKFGKKNFIPADKLNRQYAASLSYGLWSTNVATKLSRASLLKGFYVLKLGQIALPDQADISIRNLDFVDLDGIVIRGDWHGSHATTINFSSCQNARLEKTSLHHITFVHCEMDHLTCNESRLQDFRFSNCGMGDLVLRGSTINGLALDNCRIWTPIIDGTDIQRFSYVPGQYSKNHLEQADICRRLRSAFQSAGHRAESSQFYYEERCYERKAMWNPYSRNTNAFPPRSYNGTLNDLLSQARDRYFTPAEIRKYFFDIFWFHLRVWATPKYFIRAFRYKRKHFVSLLDFLIWGYGERPARVIGTSLAVIIMFTAIFYRFGEHKDVWESVYYSVFTFTTLGYGDVTRLNDALKAASTIEVLLGIILLGLFVGTLANKSRY